MALSQMGRLTVSNHNIFRFKWDSDKIGQVLLQKSVCHILMLSGIDEKSGLRFVMVLK